MDFTTATYTRLIEALKTSGYASQTITDFFESPKYKTVLLRHDVDLSPGNALAMAKLEHGMGVVATYYFRAVPESWDEGVIREIAAMGHEVGYHYECLTTASKKIRRLEGKKVKEGRSQRSEVGDQRSEARGRTTGPNNERIFEAAYEDFCGNLEKLRKLVPVSTVCMHGSPLSSIDNLHLLKKYDYKSLGLVAEPYLDLDFNEVFYLTDTGRRWDGWKVSVRDKMPQQEEWVRQGLVFHTTWDIVRAVEVSDVRGRMSDVGRRRAIRGVDVTFPDKVMMTVHPQRWTDNPVGWTKELVGQNLKNVAKRVLLSRAQ